MNRILLAFQNPSLAWRWFIKGRRSLTEINLYEIEKFMKGQGSIIEAGSSDGVDTLRLAQYFQNHPIYALEPVLEQFLATKRKVQSANNVRVFNLALGNVSGQVDLFLGNSGHGLSGMGSSSLLEPKEHLKEFPNIKFLETRRVNSLTFQDFCISQNVQYVDLLWLDVQGLELSILKQNTKFIQESVKNIHLEVSRIELYKGTPNYREVMKFIKELKFKVVIKRVGRISGNVLAVNTRI